MIENSQLKKQLHKTGGRMTPQRLTVLQIMKDSAGQHLSVDEVFSKLTQAQLGKVSPATVHRTLVKLEKMGILTKIHFKDGNKYEIKTVGEEHGHHHLVCQLCGKVEEVKEDNLDTLEDHITQNYGFTVTSHTLQFFGLCKDCSSS